MASSCITAHAQSCQNQPQIQTPKELISAWIVDQSTGQTLTSGQVVPINTMVLLHGHAEARSLCDVYVLDQGVNCVYVRTDNRTVNNIDRTYYYPPNGVQPYVKTFGRDPATGGTAFYNVLDTLDAAHSGGPSTVGLSSEGAYTFYTANLINVTGCNIAPDSISAQPIVLYARQAHPRRYCPATSGDESVLFGNPCNALTGNKTQTEVDWPGPAQRVVRTYSSDSAYVDVGFGYGWSSPLLRRVFRGNSRLIIERGTGESELFTLSSGVWSGDTVTRYKVANGANGGYAISLVDGSVEHYSAAGLLLDEVDRNGRTNVYQYDNSNRLTTWTDPFGRTSTISYVGASPRIASISDGHGYSTSYQYDSNGALTQVTYPDGSARLYSYQVIANNGNVGGALLTGITDENAVAYVAWTYDSAGRVASSKRAPGSANPVDVHTFSYTPSSYTTAVTDPLGTVWTLTYATYFSELVLRTKKNSVDNLTYTQTYSGYGFLDGKTDRLGNQACYGYDSTRIYLETLRQEGVPPGSSCYPYPFFTPPAGARRISTQWHPDWRLETKVAEPGRITTKVYNGQPDPFNGNATASCAPGGALLPSGKPIPVLCKQVEQATTDANGGQGFNASLQSGVANRVWSWTYNSLGQMLSETDPINHTTSYAYYAATSFTGTDPNAVGYTLGDLQSVTNAKGQVTTFTKYDRRGNLLESVDPNGVVSASSFDLRGRLLSTTVGGQGASYSYDAAGQLLKVTAPDSSWIGYEYDVAHRRTAVKDNLGNRIEFVLDNAGNVTGQSAKDPSGALARSLSRTMDGLGRVQQTTGRE